MNAKGTDAADGEHGHLTKPGSAGYTPIETILRMDSERLGLGFRRALVRGLGFKV